MKRSPAKKYYPGKWENAGGKIENGEHKEAAIIREVKEETGLLGRVIRPGRSFEVMAEDIIFVVHPFLVEVPSGRVMLSREHTEFSWIPVEDYVNFECVDSIDLDFKNLDLI